MSVLERFDLSGKVAVVTGGNRGLGEAWVQSLVDVGATVVIAARDDERSRAVAERMGEAVDEVHLDVRDADDIGRALETIVERHQRVDVLVDNAGACIHRPAPDVTWTRSGTRSSTSISTGCGAVAGRSATTWSQGAAA